MTLRRSRLPLIWLLLAAAVLLRAAIPAGWMPTTDQDGIRIALCTGNGSGFAVLTRDGTLHKDAPNPAAPRENCPYALAAAQAANATPAATILPPPVDLAPLEFPALRTIALLSVLRSRPPPTGPPPLA